VRTGKLFDNGHKERTIKAPASAAHGLQAQQRALPCSAMPMQAGCFLEMSASEKMLVPVIVNLLLQHG
jgi:hypothetical protein